MRDAELAFPGGALRALGRLLLRLPPVLAALLVGAQAGLIWFLSSHRVPAPVKEVFVWEFLSNLAHAPLFGTLALLVSALALREADGGWPRPRRARIAAVLLAVGSWGILDELHQSHVPGRDASALDVLTDVVSATMVLWIVYTLARPERGGRVLVLRLLAGVGLCATSALLATIA